MNIISGFKKPHFYLLHFWQSSSLLHVLCVGHVEEEEGVDNGDRIINPIGKHGRTRMNGQAKINNMILKLRK